MTTEMEQAKFRKHHTQVVPSEFRECKTLPGMIAIPLNELKEE